MFLRSKNKSFGLKLFGLAALMAGFLNSNAYACRCGRASPEAEFNKSKAVFAGKVVAIRQSSFWDRMKQRIPFLRSNLFEDFAERKTIEVSRIWKGEPASHIEIKDAGWFGFCGVPMELGVEYLVYATGNGSTLINRICSRTTELAGASEDLAYLGLGIEPPKKSRLSSLLVIFAVFAVLLALSLTGYLLVVKREGQLKKENIAESNDDTTITC